VDVKAFLSLFFLLFFFFFDEDNGDDDNDDDLVLIFLVFLMVGLSDALICFDFGQVFGWSD
jgi:hypothetical protein